MTELITWLERQIDLCDDLKSMEKEKWAFIQTLKKVRKKAINYSRCCELLICDFDNINDVSLTKGKKYTKIHEHNGMVVIINDFDEIATYNKEAFFEAN